MLKCIEASSSLNSSTQLSLARSPPPSHCGIRKGGCTVLAPYFFGFPLSYIYIYILCVCVCVCVCECMYMFMDVRMHACIHRVHVYVWTMYSQIHERTRWHTKHL